MKKAKSKKKRTPTYAIVDGKRYKYKCLCPVKSLDCVTPEMWDAEARSVYGKK